MVRGLAVGGALVALLTATTGCGSAGAVFVSSYALVSALAPVHVVVVS